jgi:hypothetical protein
MPGPGSGGPFYFAWASATDIAFGADFYRYDEAIFDFERTLSEGQIPTLSVSIKNPGIGLLSPGRQQWCWFSWWDGATVIPLFFGRLVGIPSGFTDQIIHIQFIARAHDYVARKQALAETLKVAPFYDPAFLDDSKRNDPDAILEAYAAAFHVDPVTHVWSISDILQGEDGTVVFGPHDCFYDSLKCVPGQPPKKSIRVNMKAKWAQVVTGGSVNIGKGVTGGDSTNDGSKFTFKTLTGASFIEEFPKPGARIGGGWVVQASDCVDMYGINAAQMQTFENSYENKDTTHNEGDTMSSNFSETLPICGAPLAKQLISWEQTFAIIWDDFAQPNASNKQTFMYVPTWLLSAYLYLEYEADRKRTEELSFVMTADVQPVLTDPTVQQDSEVIDMQSVDLGVPFLLSANWTVLAGRPVARGQITFPNDPLTAGLISYQICVFPGVAGTVEPNFSNVVGATTVDGSVIWACIGPSIPAINDWNPSIDVSLGTLIAPVYPAWIYYSALLPPVYPMRLAGAEISVGQLIRADDNSSFQMATIGGATGFSGTPPAFSTTYGATTNDGEVQWTSLGPILPSGTIQMAIAQGTTDPQVPPPFSVNEGDTVQDGSVTWASLGFGNTSSAIPVGGVVGNVTARSYFPSYRGNLSIQYALMKARAHLLTSARAVDVSFETPFALGVPLTCRMNATIQEAPVPPNPFRLPGGQATGKIIKSVIKGDGATGKFVSEITIGCAVGNGGTTVVNAGTPSYSADYFAPGYQVMLNQTALADTNDVGYSRPVDNPNDDGLTFPLDAEGVVLTAKLSRTLAEQQANIQAAQAQPIFGPPVVSEGPGNAQASLSAQQFLEMAMASPGCSIWLDLALKPVTGQQFTTAYAIDVTPLKVIKQIDLAA